VGLDPSFLWFNLKPEAKASDPRRHWLQHADLRRAISHAVDRQAFAETVYRGAAVPVHGPVTPGNRLWYSNEPATYPYDPDRARALLAGLGLADRNGDGISEDASGRPAAFSLLTQKGNTARERSAAVLQEDLRRIGLRVDVVALEFGALIDRITRAEYDASYFGPQASDTDPASNLDFWRSSGAFHFWNAGQPRPATEWERRIDELMDRQIATTDQVERRRLFTDVQRIFAAELPAIAFAAPRIMVAMSARVANATPALLRPQVLWNPDVLAVSPTSSSDR
jgi:peptide/nickel transport system substrate-binding protein